VELQEIKEDLEKMTRQELIDLCFLLIKSGINQSVELLNFIAKMGGRQ